jgi:uncharacterized protein
VHVSEIAHKYITDPNEVLKLNQQVQVKVTEVDIARKRIALSIKQTQEAPAFKDKAKRSVDNSANAASSTTIDDALNLLKKKFGK